MKKGFTLIELLAVIVILAIIALIATPIVLNIIEDSKNSSMLRSSEMYLDAVEYSIAKGVLNNKRITNGTYNILESGNICIEYDGSTCTNELEIEVKGETPVSGTITIDGGVIKNHTLTYESNITIVDGSINNNEIPSKLAPGLYDGDDNLLISWEDLTSTDYKSFTYEKNGKKITSGILNVDENGALTSALDQTTYENYSKEYLNGKLVIDESVTIIDYAAFEYCDGLIGVIIPNTVTYIGAYAFDGCSGLTSITIPSSVTIIDFNAFSGCTGLTSITIPGTVTSIGDAAFEFCIGLTSVTILDGVTIIYQNAFSGCTGLTGITIPNSVTSIGYWAFSGCTGLTTINYTGSEEQWNAISFGEDWDSEIPTDKQIIFNYKG